MLPAVGHSWSPLLRSGSPPFVHDLVVHLVHKVLSAITCTSLLVQYSGTSRHAKVEDLVDLILDGAPPGLLSYVISPSRRSSGCR
eukprot:8777786-Heterocapsa_arctica.AAC.1